MDLGADFGVVVEYVGCGGEEVLEGWVTEEAFV